MQGIRKIYLKLYLNGTVIASDDTLGFIGEHMSTALVFEIPPQLKADSYTYTLNFEDDTGNVWVSVLGNDYTFVVPNELTQNNFLTVQLTISEADSIVFKGNRVEFKLHNSVSTTEVANKYTGLLEDTLDKFNNLIERLDSEDFSKVNGIISIEKTDVNGLQDTYTVTYTDSTTSTFIVTNGSKGEKGDKGDNGDSYILTEADKQEIAEKVDCYSTTETDTLLSQKATVIDNSIINGEIIDVSYTQGNLSSTGDISDGYRAVSSNLITPTHDLAIKCDPSKYNLKIGRFSSNGEYLGNLQWNYTDRASRVFPYVLKHEDNISYRLCFDNPTYGNNTDSPSVSDILADVQVYDLVSEVDYTDKVPAYYNEALTTAEDTINQIMEQAGFNKSAFLFYSDAHWTYSRQHTPALLRHLLKNTSLTKVVFGGDIVNTESAESRADIQYLYDWQGAMKEFNHHSVIGNHDNDIVGYQSNSQVYSYLLAGEESSDVVRGGYFYYYVDCPAEKTRYLYLDTGLFAVSDDETQFVINALKSTPDGWHIVAISHIWFIYDDVSTPTVGSTPIYCGKLLNLFDSYNNRTSGSITMVSTTLDYDFTNAVGNVEFCIGGHIHADYDFTSEGGIPVILTECESLHSRSGLSTTLGTPNETAITAVIADYDSHKINLVRIGRGEDKTVEITNYVITYTNQIPISTDTDGSVYNDIGYKADVRLSSSNGYAEVALEGVYLTGFIPAQPGDIVRLKNITMPQADTTGYGCNVYLSQDGTSVIGHIISTGFSNNWCPVYDDNGNLIQFTVSATQTGVTHIRVGATMIDVSSVITVNEEI